MVEYILGWIHPILAQHPLLGPMIFIAAHTLMAVFFLPCSPMTLLAGILWGGAYGLAISMLAALASSATTFLLSGSFLRGKIENFLIHRYPKVTELLAQTALHDWKIIAVSQLNPLVPASTLGYAFGLSPIPLRRYILFSAVFMLPLQLLFVLTGHSVIGLFVSDGKWGVALALIFLVAMLLAFGKRIYRIICQLFGVKNGS
jgi:uncharacterized membrane protein YdjX (TVP38/TMEM64 family)